MIRCLHLLTLDPGAKLTSSPHTSHRCIVSLTGVGVAPSHTSCPYIIGLSLISPLVLKSRLRLLERERKCCASLCTTPPLAPAIRYRRIDRLKARNRPHLQPFLRYLNERVCESFRLQCCHPPIL